MTSWAAALASMSDSETSCGKRHPACQEDPPPVRPDAEELGIVLHEETPASKVELEKAAKPFCLRGRDKGFADHQEVRKNGDRPLLLFTYGSRVFDVDLNMTVDEGESGGCIIFKEEDSFFSCLSVETLHPVGRNLHIFAEDGDLARAGFLQEQALFHGVDGIDFHVFIDSIQEERHGLYRFSFPLKRRARGSLKGVFPSRRER